MLKNHFYLLVCFILSLNSNAQNISVSENHTDQQLIQKIFDNNSCLTPTNIKINGYVFSDNTKSYGYFTNTNPAFALQEGILITSGKAKSAVGPNNRILSEGPRSWAGDRDLEIAINESNTFNATSIEFEIEAVSSQFSFDYIFSSEQYLSNPASYQCNYSDGFAFLIKEIDNPQAAYQNLAVIPNTNIPIKIPTVRAQTANCPESFPEYFGGFNGVNHPTNYNGQTVILTAKADVTPGKKYKFKLVVADQGNELYDSAIFLAAGSFKNSIDLGVDKNVKLCNASTLSITPTPLNNVQHYTWYKDGNIIPTHNQVSNPNINITQAGKYKLEAYINANCIITEEIDVSNTNLFINNELHEICTFTAQPVPYNILLNNNLGFNTHPNDSLSFYYTQADAAAGINAISNTVLENFLPQNGTTILYTRGYDFLLNCVATGTYTIKNELGSQSLPNQIICDMVKGQTYDLAPFLPYPNSTSVIIFDNIDNANTFSDPANITGTSKVYLNIGENNFYIVYPNNLGCGEKYSLKITVIGSDLVNEDLSFCEGDSLTLSAPAGFLTYTWSTGETTQNIKINQPGVYTLKVKSASNCELSKQYTVTEIKKPIAFNEFISLCSFNTNGQKQINLKELAINYTTPGNNFFIYTNLVDLNQNSNAIEIDIVFQNSKTYYIKELNTSRCETISELTLWVNFPSVLAQEKICQLNNGLIDLTSIIMDVKASYPNNIVHFYTNFNDAENKINELIGYKTTQAIQNLYVSVSDVQQNCIQNFIIPIDIDSVYDLPNEVKTICKNEQIELYAPSGNYTYLWNTGDSSQRIYINQIGQYTVTITTTNGCSFTKTFIVNQSQSAQIIDVKINQFANIKNSVTVITAGNESYEYSLDGINYQTANIFTLIKPGEYTVYVKDPNGCGITTKPILVLDIPNFFTPNADGINDTWNIENLYRVYPDAEVFIVDRFGKVMTYLYANKPDWDGISFGKKQPSTDYWYVIKLNNGNTYKGHFSLKR
jgi:gliding motility-associated-like protein